jgi:hypothetical protein
MMTVIVTATQVEVQHLACELPWSLLLQAIQQLPQSTAQLLLLAPPVPRASGATCSTTVAPHHAPPHPATSASLPGAALAGERAVAAPSGTGSHSTATVCLQCASKKLERRPRVSTR